MAYTPTVWKTGDVITAEKLNKAEQGIADADGNVYIAIAELQEGSEAPVITQGVLADAITAFSGGRVVLLHLINGNGHLTYYAVKIIDGNLCLFTVDTGVSAFNIFGVKWTTNGLAQWSPSA